MARSYKKEFYEFVRKSNLKILDVVPEINIQKGDMIIFTNDYGVEFGPCEVFGFAKEPNPVTGERIYINKSSYWCPVRISQVRLAE